MGSDDLVLVLGAKNLSSWSLRPWLAAKVASIPFREIVIPFRQADTAAQIAKASPSAKIPVLQVGECVIWDSLAICEYFSELKPDAQLWPKGLLDRALCRAVSAEMHSGFPALRTEFPMNILNRIEGRAPSAQAAIDIGRIVSVWVKMRKTYSHAGPFLFGHFTIADAMYAPVATRFQSYGIDLTRFGDDGSATDYGKTILSMPQMQEWREGATGN